MRVLVIKAHYGKLVFNIIKISNGIIRHSRILFLSFSLANTDINDKKNVTGYLINRLINKRRRL